MEHIHSFCLIEGNNDKGYAMLYDKIRDYTSKNYAVIYAVEVYATQAVRRMSQQGVEVETLVESGMLTIVGRDAMYSPATTRLEGHAVLDAWHALILKVKRKAKVDGILAIGSAGTFFENASHKKLIAYEQLIGKSFQIPVEAICCYDAQSVAALSLGDLVAILNAHHSTIHRGCSYREWDQSMITELARSGISRVLGAEMSNLLFKTMKLVYKINDSKIASNPELLGEVMAKIMGRDAARETMACVADEVRKHVAYNA
jgi:hypothetical protein